MTQSQDLEMAIAALEAQRGELGDKVVDIAIEPLQSSLDALRTRGWAAEREQRLKQVTVLFADIVESTAIARQLDPEDIHAIMDGSLAILTAIVEEHRGQVLQYAGDSLLAAFGASESREEDPENAVRAGLALLAASREFALEVKKQHGLDRFNIRVGINTGRVLLGGGVNAESNIRGLTVHVAARMEQNAPAGGMRISHNTYRQVRGVFEVSEQSAIAVKGIVEPVRSYLVRGLKPRAFRSRARGIDGVETRMIGRDNELAKLQGSFHSLYDGANRHHDAARTITVVADPGLGKSRLLYEFENWAETRSESYYLFKGRADRQTRRQSYGLLRDILAWRLQIAESDSATVAREKLSKGISPLLGPNEAAQVDILGHLVGLDFSASPHLRGILDDPQQVRNSGFHAASLIFRRLTETDGSPCVLILDDLHWADDDSLDFLNYLFEVNRDMPMLAIGMTRPELYGRRPNWPAGDESACRIDLHPLNRSKSRELASELLNRMKDIPAALRQLITSSADGNPFYMEELIKMLLDEGAIVSDTERWRAVPEKLLSAQVPDTLTGIVQARLDSLSADARATLQRASVIGFVFWDHALAALDKNSPEHLPTLVQRELIVPQPVSTFEGAREYSFHHHILYQVTYESLLKHDRQKLHLGMALWLENGMSERGDEYLGSVANHYEQAGEAGHAVDYYTLAAEDASARHGLDATLHYVRKALDLAPLDDHQLRWRLLAAREKIFATQEDREAHEADLAALRTTAEALGDGNLVAESLSRQAMALCNEGSYSAAEETSRSVLLIAKEAGNGTIMAEALGTQAFSLRRMGDFSGAQLAAEAGLRFAREAGDRGNEGELLSNLAGLAAESGDLYRSVQLDEEYLAITRETGDRASEINALNTAGDNAFRLGDYIRARQYLDEGLELSRTIGHRYGECVLLLNLAVVTNLQQENREAIIFAQDSIAISAQRGLRDLEAAALLPMGLALTELGEADEARGALERSRDLFEKNSCPHLALEPIAGLAQAALNEDETGIALEYVESILQHLRNDGSLDGTEEPLRILWTVYEVLRRTGDMRARSQLSEAHQQLEERSNRISDPGMRSIFLNNVPHNLAIETEWQRLSGG